MKLQRSRSVYVCVDMLLTPNDNFDPSLTGTESDGFFVHIGIVHTYRTRL